MGKGVVTRQTVTKANKNVREFKAVEVGKDNEEKAKSPTMVKRNNKKMVSKGINRNEEKAKKCNVKQEVECETDDNPSYNVELRDSNYEMDDKDDALFDEGVVLETEMNEGDDDSTAHVPHAADSNNDVDDIGFGGGK
ncbi:hypothetical protein ACH5RR_022724 [Cinchona calisaya]|uniref:Uncharacterized protein n=1 Tax=Cinchona calisaya TaxID=153742 RepID=A0ABD2ZCI4_9GENT